MCSCSSFFFFFFNDTATTEIYTLSLHDALPIWHHAPAPAAELAAHRDGLAGGRVGDDEIVAAVRPIDRHGRRSDVLHHQTGCRSAVVDDVVAARRRVDVLVDAAFAGEVLVPEPGDERVVAIGIAPDRAAGGGALL